jgi:hypothetical protein
MTADFVIQHTWLSRPAAPLRRRLALGGSKRIESIAMSSIHEDETPHEHSAL